MDILELEGFIKGQEAGAWITIKIGDRPTSFRVKVCGPDSRRAREARHTVINRQMKRANVIPGGRAAIMEADHVATVAGFIMGWEGLAQHGEPVAFSKNNAVEICTKYRFVLEQVEIAVNTRSLFVAPEKDEQ
ncbi:MULTISPECIES: hypothetical protein [unclassified Mesorhizobium]|uniref:hypothetical protein n=1 Tax=unclassified Mesorhizobium TaxID=325217 RepID=UPI0011276A0A|nr:MULTISPECIES: hypothetical protein [unclassified Mesorhizobium]TPK42635.1 hypothetical protein FJ550_29715 [Mesorhizobium sp. B2-5-2]TPL26755.1 hypothetical protein FJ946_13035 [Mesorhizobium sp. B2-4-7]TPL40533.1 hypothetical protein FJ961_17335 [Mesorhizobium sp. B2-4-5]TPM76807.1 hypothetical protein FJ968_03565 [Mesorhizobium sp. B2-1-6]TPN72470.1 hypothetical protein FJ985_29220 [Mesorhizobium sp. B1-1-2]